MAKDVAKRLDIGRKSRFTPPKRRVFHSGPPTGQKIGLYTTFSGCYREQYSMEDFVTQ